MPGGLMPGRRSGPHLGISNGVGSDRVPSCVAGYGRPSLWMVAFSASAPYQTPYEPLLYRVFKYGAFSKG